jgi:very-short-patch-repair endonuclease
MSKYKQQIIDNYEIVMNEMKSGESLRAICQTLDLNYYAFYKKIKSEKPDMLNRDWKSDKLKQRYAETQKIDLDSFEIIRMYKEELIPARKIAEKYNVAQNTILRIIKESGVDKNNQSLYWTEERRERQRALCYDGIIGIHAQGNGAYRFTKPEREFAKWCEENDISYERQYQISPGMHNYDFRIVGTNILVEIDGDFWHCTPEQKQKDEMFEEQAKEHNLTIIRFSDKIIYKTKSKCFNKIFEYMSDLNYKKLKKNISQRLPI